MAGIFASTVYDSAYDESHVQKRREPRAAESNSSQDRGLYRSGHSGEPHAIDSFVSALDLAKLGFGHAGRGVGVAQPPYDPSDLLKLYLYGYINQIRSSRRLEREACRNLELIWLLKNLKPGYRTIASFRKENWAALKAANRGFVLLLRELDLRSVEPLLRSMAPCSTAMPARTASSRAGSGQTDRQTGPGDRGLRELSGHQRCSGGQAARR